jgi:hypothetical protein
MNDLGIGGKLKEVVLGGHYVTVITPKKSVSYEEGMKRIDKLISEIKRKR